ncbi:integrase_H2C2 domain-containing protein [Trichonephila clavipes]|nr:integrase_H2C2 domain-containing protein [Trichonephila clavipes]
MPVTATDIARATKTDRKLFELYESLKSGTELPVPWKGRESEFSLQNGCIMYGHRVCIPEKYQNQVLEELHVGHPGIVKMKAIARSYCYWQAPYHPATNGQAERIVQLLKASLKSSRGDSGDLNVKLQRFLLQYRITPHSLTGETPSALFLKRCLRTRLDLFKPNLRDKVVQKQSSRLDTESILHKPVSDDVAESEPPAPVPEVVPEPKDVPVPATPSDDIPPKPVPDASGKPKTDVPLRRSNRIRRPPKRLDLLLYILSGRNCYVSGNSQIREPSKLCDARVLCLPFCVP